MFAWFLVALVALTVVAALGVLADSGLRWWSAFGQLWREMKQTSVIAGLPAFSRRDRTRWCGFRSLALAAGRGCPPGYARRLMREYLSSVKGSRAR